MNEPARRSRGLAADPDDSRRVRAARGPPAARLTAGADRLEATELAGVGLDDAVGAGRAARGGARSGGWGSRGGGGMLSPERADGEYATLADDGELPRSPPAERAERAGSEEEEADGAAAGPEPGPGAGLGRAPAAVTSGDGGGRLGATVSRSNLGQKSAAPCEASPATASSGL